eukprot:TRINITY_DN13568_c0_g1_i1.p1 TRINITY_DN13568_c0_g1~~TRINITY_DN13568_c0_g1_i1.p1  ORF type:complete len:724 (+),score=129.90 TRINITY_DN13568_c0_g1_i1:221-2392(+)
MAVRRRGGQRSRKARDAAAVHEDTAGEVGSENAKVAVPSKRSGQARSAQGLKPDIDEVLRCIESLYADQLKPFGRILRKRIAERYVEQQQALGEPRLTTNGSSSDLPDVDIKHLRTVCEECEELKMQPEEGGDWSAVFRDRPDEFVDIYDPTDNYPEHLWKAAAEYFGGLDETESVLPGGRYSCAQALLLREIPFLEGFTLGKVCHMVQVAIAKHKILGYCNGAVVPYSRSQSRVKEECANSGRPCLNGETGDSAKSGTALPLATLDVARQHLREILENAAVPDEPGPSMIPLSNVKRLFRSKYQIELSETTLGHSKLSELLQDQRFADICTVQLQGQGYIVVQTQSPSSSPRSNNTISIADCLAGKSDENTSEQLNEAPRIGFCPDEPLCFEELEVEGEHAQAVPTPTPFAPTPAVSPGAATPSTMRRWPLYAQWQSGILSKDALGYNPAYCSSMQPVFMAAVPQVAFNHFSQDAPLSDRSGFEEMAAGCGSSSASTQASACIATPPSPAHSSGRGRQTTERSVSSPGPKDDPMKVSVSLHAFGGAEGTSLLQLIEQPLWSEAGSGDLEEDSSRPSRFCQDEPLILEDDCSATSKWPTLDDEGVVAASDVKNTFIHAAVTPLVTPLPGALRRSRSLPKNVGSEIAIAEDSHSKGMEDSNGNDPASVIPSPANLVPPTPSSPLFYSKYNGHHWSASVSAPKPALTPKPGLNPWTGAIRLSELI